MARSCKSGWLAHVNQNGARWVNEFSSGEAGHYFLREQILVKGILELSPFLSILLRKHLIYVGKEEPVGSQGMSQKKIFSHN